MVEESRFPGTVRRRTPRPSRLPAARSSRRAAPRRRRRRHTCRSRTSITAAGTPPILSACNPLQCSRRYALSVTVPPGSAVLRARLVPVRRGRAAEHRLRVQRRPRLSGGGRLRVDDQPHAEHRPSRPRGHAFRPGAGDQLRSARRAPRVILTGKYSHLNGVLDNRLVFDGAQQTFPKLLQAPDTRPPFSASGISKARRRASTTGKCCPARALITTPTCASVRTTSAAGIPATSPHRHRPLAGLAEKPPRPRQAVPADEPAQGAAPQLMPGPEHLALYDGEHVWSRPRSSTIIPGALPPRPPT